MWKLSDLINDYAEPEDLVHKALQRGLPIETPKHHGWSVREDPSRLTKMFKFSEESVFNAFVIDLLELQSETGHHARITLQYPKVKVEVWTHTLKDITEIDLEWAMSVNEIYEGTKQ